MDLERRFSVDRAPLAHRRDRPALVERHQRGARLRAVAIEEYDLGAALEAQRGDVTRRALRQLDARSGREHGFAVEPGRADGCALHAKIAWLLSPEILPWQHRPRCAISAARPSTSTCRAPTASSTRSLPRAGPRAWS